MRGYDAADDVQPYRAESGDDGGGQERCAVCGFRSWMLGLFDMRASSAAVSDETHELLLIHALQELLVALGVAHLLD